MKSVVLESICWIIHSPLNAWLEVEVNLQTYFLSHCIEDKWITPLEQFRTPSIICLNLTFRLKMLLFITVLELKSLEIDLGNLELIDLSADARICSFWGFF